MRLALALLLAAACAAPASAQSPFVSACVASSDGEAEAAEICACGETGALAAGATAENLSALMDYVDADNALDLESVPEPLQPTANMALESLVGCTFELAFGEMGEALGEMGAALGEAMEQAFEQATPSATEGEGTTGELSAAVVPSLQPEVASRPSAPGTALRVTGPAPTVRSATQASRGAAIRIR